MATRAPGARFWGIHASQVPVKISLASSQNGDPLMTDALAEFERTHLERLKLAADILLSEHDAITDSLEVELTIFRDQVEHALLSGHTS